MNYIVNKFRYIVYPAEGPRPPDAESVAIKLREEKARLAEMRQASKEKREKSKAAMLATEGSDTGRRKKWFGLF